MIQHREGLTKTYNHFHDLHHQNAPEIVTLRNLHAAMDRAVLDAYGWEDIRTDCEFLPDYEIDKDEAGAKKKPYRYRWPDEVRNRSTIARLLELNTHRAAEEGSVGKVSTTAAQTGTERWTACAPAGRACASREAEPRPLWTVIDTKLST